VSTAERGDTGEEDGVDAGQSTPAPRTPPDFLVELFTNALDPGYADAAARREREGRPHGRSWVGLIARIVALFAVGFLLAVAYREAVAAEPERSEAHAGLVDEVQAAQARTDDLQRRNDELRQRVGALRRAALGGESEELRRIREQEAVTGLVAVRGAGVVVTLTDAAPQIDPTTGRPSVADVSRVLDVDLQSVVNGLWASGAEAVAINGQRLTSTSTIRSAGNAVLVDFRPVTSPYDVSAIGPDDLDDRFNATGAAATARGLVERYGLGFSVPTESDLRLPAAGAQSLRPAPPLAPAGATATPSGGPK
jgi:uncharacterized protein YlxW (UPF0749 family)